MKNTLISLTVSLLCLPLLPALEYWAPDPSFAGTEFHETLEQSNLSAVADGRSGIFVWTNSFRLSGVGDVVTSPLVRFHEETLELDTSFSADPRILWVGEVFTGPQGGVYAGVELPPDPWDAVTSTGNYRLVRLLPGGEIDPLFVSPLFAWPPRSIAFDSLGRIAVAVQGVDLTERNPHGLAHNSVCRLLADGRIDTGFVAAVPHGPESETGLLSWTVAVDSEDRIVSGARSDWAPVARYKADGRLDESFVFDHGGELPGLQWTRALHVTPDGRILAAGLFRSSSGDWRPVLRMEADGTVESDYEPLFIDSSGNPVGETGAHLGRTMEMRDGTVVIPGRAIRLMDAYGEPLTGVSGLSLTGLPLPEGAIEWWLVDAWRASLLGDGSVLVSWVHSSARGDRGRPSAQVAPFVISQTSEIFPIKALAAVSRRSAPDIVRRAPDGRFAVAGGTLPRGTSSRGGGQAAAGPAWFSAEGILEETVEIADRRLTNIGRTADGWLVSADESGRSMDVYRFPDGGGEPEIVVESRPRAKRLFHVDGGGVYVPGPGNSVAILLRSLAVGDEERFRWNLEVFTDGVLTPFPTTLTQVRLHRSAEYAFPDFGEWVEREVVGEFDDGGLLVLQSVVVASGFELIRLSPDGTPDSGFPPVFLPQRSPITFDGYGLYLSDLTVAIWSDVSGETGTVDVRYPGQSPVAEVVRAPGGGWIVAGAFTEIGGIVRNGLAKVLPDGTIDPEFAAPRHAGSALAGQRVDSVLVSDGGDRIWVAGAFSEIGGLRAPGILALDTEGRPLDSVVFAVRSTAGFGERALIGRADENSVYLFGNVRTMDGGADAGGLSPGLVKLVRTTTPGEYWHPEFGEIYGYGSGGWFHVSGIGLLHHYGSGWYGHFAARGAEWLRTGAIYAPGVVTDAALPLYHSTYGWIHLSPESGLHYRWADEAWFAEW